MADTAAHLVDRVFPAVPVRQWVLSLPFALRYRLAYDASLVTDVLRIFVSVVFGSVRRRAHFAASDRSIRCGSVTFVQRFGGKLNLNVHFHMLALDGVYAEDKEGHIRFHRVPPPSDAEVTRVAGRIHRRVERLIEHRNLGSQADPLLHDQPLLAELYSASVSGRVASGPRTGRRLKIGDKVNGENPAALPGSRCAAISGFSLHANVAVSAHDRMGLERLARYAGRPPLATERLSRLPNGRLLYRRLSVVVVSHLLPCRPREGALDAVLRIVFLADPIILPVPDSRGGKQAASHPNDAKVGVRWRSLRGRTPSEPNWRRVQCELRDQIPTELAA